jgi:hypothetical protein
VLAHPYGGNCRTLEPVAIALPHAGHNAVSFSLRGSGPQSEVDDCCLYKAERHIHVVGGNSTKAREAIRLLPALQAVAYRVGVRATAVT